jgi:hypothetical protein
MAKSIKHITAGLLHVEVIGTVPDPQTGRRARGGRSRPTSPAQQFYNNKCSWRELELVVAANFGSADMVVTFTYDDAHLPPTKRAGDILLQKMFRKLRTVRRRRGEELKYIYATEGAHGAVADEYFGDDRELEDRRIHHHVVINRVGPDDLDELRSLWPYGGYVRIEPLDVHYYQELAKYLTKEAREFGRAKPGERSWRASRNLKKYEVEYIDIPSDSVTLAPPSGAVDYVQFSEKNPYGFADCTGARYLLFSVPSAQTYSYTRGRQTRKPG